MRSTKASSFSGVGMAVDGGSVYACVSTDCAWMIGWTLELRRYTTPMAASAVVFAARVRRSRRRVERRGWREVSFVVVDGTLESSAVVGSMGGCVDDVV